MYNSKDKQLQRDTNVTRIFNNFDTKYIPIQWRYLPVEVQNRVYLEAIWYHQKSRYNSDSRTRELSQNELKNRAGN